MTTPYHIKLAPPAKKQILTLTREQQKYLIKYLDALAINPRPPGAQRIDGMTGLYVQTINHSRIIYKVEEHDVLVLVIK